MTELTVKNWESLLLNRDNAAAKIHAIASLLKQDVSSQQNGGLMGGLSGHAVFFAEYGHYTGEDQSAIINDLLERAFENVQTHWHPVSFCAGIAGLLWTVDYLQKNYGLELEGDFSDTDTFIAEQMDMYAQKNDFDFLHGAGGLFYYFLHSGRAIDTQLFDRYLTLLESFALPKPGGGLAWESLVDLEHPHLVCNISLSHGSSATAMILAKALEFFPDNDRVKRLLTGAVSFILQCKRKEQRLSLFPAYVGDPEAEERESRLGWCYGDLGVGLTLLKAGNALQRNDFITEGLAILRHTAARRDLAENAVRDAGLCHGAAGIAHIFNRVYQQSGDVLFKDAALYWYDITFQMGEDAQEGLAGFSYYNATQGWIAEPNLLEGAAGIGLALMAASCDKSPDWDACLLIN